MKKQGSTDQVLESKAFTADDFAKAYEELVKKMGFRIYASPAFVARDDSTFSLVVNLVIGATPKNAT